MEVQYSTVFVISLIFFSVAYSNIETTLPCCIPGIPLDDSPVAAVDHTVTEAVDYTVMVPVVHPTVGASMTPTAMKHQAAGMTLCSF